MVLVEFIPVLTEQGVEKLREIVKEVWEEHFTPILGEKQVHYMLENYQSKKTITEQVMNGKYSYYFIRQEEMNIGYLAYYIEGSSLFLSKLYILKSGRGKKASSQALSYLEKICKQNNIEKIRLQCNKYNDNTISVYQHFGFEIVDEKVTDIGEGYVMDDYFMEKKMNETIFIRES